MTKFRYSGYVPNPAPPLREPCEEGNRATLFLLTLVCRVTGWNYYWFRDETQRCRLRIVR